MYSSCARLTVRRFDPFSFKQNGPASAEVDIGRGVRFRDALVIPQMIVVGDELADPASRSPGR